MKICKMKQFIFSVLLVAGVADMAQAQNIRLNAYSAFTLDDQVDSHYSSSNYYDGTIKGGYQWGAGVEYMVSPTRGIELKYLRQDASAPMVYFYSDERRQDFNLGLNYILLGGNNYFKTAGEMIEPYVGAGLGVAIISVKNPIQNGNSSLTKFAFNLKAGTNIWVTKRVGIKLEANLLSAVKGASNAFYLKNDISGIGLTSPTTILQFGLGGGLTYRIGK